MPEAPYIHPSAVVDEGAILEDGVKVWHFCHVMTGTRLGTGTSLGQNTFVASGVTTGSIARSKQRKPIPGRHFRR